MDLFWRKNGKKRETALGERIDFIAREQQRLDVLLAEAMEATRSRAAALIREGRVEVEGVRREKAGF